jgi:hypothetical protein
VISVKIEIKDVEDIKATRPHPDPNQTEGA